MTESSPSMRFAQKNVLVTGAAAGLGRHIAQAFAAEGADIAILDFQDASATAREITALKRRRITALAADFIARYRLAGRPCRFDVVSIRMDRGLATPGGLTATIEVFQHAFDAVY